MFIAFTAHHRFIVVIFHFQIHPIQSFVGLRIYGRCLGYATIIFITPWDFAKLANAVLVYSEGYFYTGSIVCYFS
jgi:hypothetical protein